MTPGIWIIRPGDTDFRRQFGTMSQAEQVMKPHDLVINVGTDGREQGRWIKTEDGRLVVVKKMNRAPYFLRRRYRDRFGPPPAGGRGPDGHPIGSSMPQNDSAVG